MSLSAEQIDRLKVLGGELMEFSLNDCGRPEFKRIESELGRMADERQAEFKAAVSKHLPDSQQHWVNNTVDCRVEQFLPDQLAVIALDTVFQQLKNQAIKFEREYYNPQCKRVDGCPYTGLCGVEFLNSSMDFFGGVEQIRSDITEISCFNPQADPDCGNWWFWMVLHKFGVARENPYEQIEVES